MDHNVIFQTCHIQKYLGFGFLGENREIATCIKGELKGSKIFFADNHKGESRLHILKCGRKRKRQVKFNEFVDDLDNDWIVSYEDDAQPLSFDLVLLERHDEIMRRRMAK